METEPSPEILFRREELQLVIGVLASTAAQENNVYVTADIDALVDLFIDRYNALGEL